MPPNVHFSEPICFPETQDEPPHFKDLTDSANLTGLTLAELRDRIMTEPEGPMLTNVLAEIASRLDLNVCLEDFHVAQQLFHVSGLNTKLQTSRKWTPADTERFYWQRRRLHKALIRITKPNWRALHRCDEFCVDDCYFVCPVNEELCYKCAIMYPVYVAKYPQRSYFHNLVNVIKSSFKGTTSSR